MTIHIISLITFKLRKLPKPCKLNTVKFSAQKHVFWTHISRFFNNESEVIMKNISNSTRNIRCTLPYGKGTRNMKHCFLKKQVKPQSPQEKYTVMRLSGNEQKGFHDAVSGSQ